MHTPSCEYLAGLFDGEGCITVSTTGLTLANGQKQRVLLVTVTNCHRPTIDMLHTRFGGSINVHGHNDPKRRAAWKWMAKSQLAATFLRCIQPFLVIKRDECDIALELQERFTKYQHRSSGSYRGGNQPMSSEEFDAREALIHRLRTHPNRRYDPRYFSPTLP